MRSLPDEQSLKLYAGHVIYEVRCFREALRGMDEVEDPALNNVISEALLLHTRNLLEFFWPNRRHPDGIYASHFTTRPPRIGESEPVAGGRNVRELQRRLHRRLAHLSQARVTEKSVGESWCIAELAESLRSELAHFVDGLPAHRSGWFENAVLMEKYRHWPAIDCWLRTNSDSDV
jgi:hypothetical protein